MGTMKEVLDDIVLSVIKRNNGKVKKIIDEVEDGDTSEGEIKQIGKNFQKDILVNDFQQCMYMLRHYDTVNWDLTKFAFGQVLIVIGACWTILNHQKGNAQTVVDVLNDGITNYIVGGILLFSALFVLVTLAAIMRNRSYFVKMSRYINEHRRNVLSKQPFGFNNESHMWNNPSFPNLIDKKSTQMLCLYLFYVIFCGLVFSSAFCFLISCTCGVCWSLVVAVFWFIVARMLVNRMAS